VHRDQLDGGRDRKGAPSGGGTTMRIILYTGKGGVGKTSVAAATALRSAGLGHRTLVMSTDAAHSLADCLDLPLGAEPTPIAENLWGQELDIYQTIDAQWGTIQKWLEVVMAWRGIDEVLAEEMAILPGMDELSSLLHLSNYVETEEYDVVIVDCAPTGETLRLLSFPDILRWWLHRIFPIQRATARVVRPVITRITDLPMPSDEVFAAVKELLAGLEDMRDILTDPEISSMRLIVNLERMVIKEAQRTYTYLNLYGYATDAVICNRLLPDNLTDSYFEAWKETQGRYYATVEEAFSPLPILKGPLMDQEVVGLEMLQRFARALYRRSDPTRVLYKGHARRIRQEDGAYLLTLDLPFASREQISLSQVGDELIVHVGAYRRNLVLPRALVGLESEGAELEDNTLTIRFRPSQPER
jgi:arsenite-transporting ATPase